MKECPACSRCFPDQVNHCPSDGDLLKFTITGEPVLDGRYQLEKRLGQGGMGLVYKARHIFLKTQLAIKIILPDLVGNDPSLTTRFRQEAMAAAAVHHQNTIRVTDFGIVNGTMPFLVMEFIEGLSLHDILQREKRLAPARALEIMLAVCAGVNAAHEFGIVHRDLKPLNIILQNGRPLSEGVKVLDFGLAKIKSGDLLGSFVAAQTQGMMGSPFYMAPEQWSDEEVDVRADIYSLGIILYQMLAGDVPFRGGSVPAIMKKHLIDPPTPLSERGVLVPPALEAVVRHALEKEANHRPASVTEFMGELRVALAAVNAEAVTAELGARTIQIGQDETLEQMRRQESAKVEESVAPLVGSETVASLPVVDTGTVGENSGASVSSPVITGRQPSTPGGSETAQQQANLTAAFTQPEEASQHTRLAAASESVQTEEKESARLHVEEQRQREEAAERARLEAEAREKREAEEARLAAEEEQRKREAEQEEREAQEKAEREAADKERLALAERQRREAVEKQRREVEEKEQRAAAAELASRAALEREQAEQARLEAEEQARLQAMERERREADERERSVASERQRREAEELARREEEERAALIAAAQKAELERQAAREKQAAKDASASSSVQVARDSSTQVSQTSPVVVASSPSRAPMIALGAVVLLALLAGAGGYAAYRAGFFGSSSNANVSNNTNPVAGTNTNADAKPKGNTTKPDLAQLPGGAFTMGRNDVPPVSGQYAAAYLLWVYSQWPAHSVNVKPFAIDKTEVTNAEYAEFVKASGHTPPPDWDGSAPKAGEELWPVRSVSFDDAQAFAAWRSQRDGATYRLPTEEEWEYAARGGGDAARMFPWGGEWKDGLANLNSEAPQPVGSFHAGATPQGVEDMIGNVAEWTSSPAAMYAGNNRTTLADKDRGSVVIRGGSYKGKADGDKPFTATTRSWITREVRDPTLGFRLVRAGQP